MAIPEREKPGHMYREEDYLQSGLPKEATILGTLFAVAIQYPGHTLKQLFSFSEYLSSANWIFNTTGIKYELLGLYDKNFTSGPILPTFLNSHSDSSNIHQ
ncbi:hypothetical protein P7K49_021741 [Saguinus oedipus]|uniref:Uncharacterized protein n=1 Tax=Saguinus oedipus TaxID=9490 RepID=A0ABQ9UTI1_SAGOE|nr:hypothetical protein P7K49_021741 [Saguinus oedipus]